MMQIRRFGGGLVSLVLLWGTIALPHLRYSAEISYDEVDFERTCIRENLETACGMLQHSPQLAGFVCLFIRFQLLNMVERYVNQLARGMARPVRNYLLCILQEFVPLLNAEQKNLLSKSILLQKEEVPLEFCTNIGCFNNEIIQYAQSLCLNCER